MLLANLPYELLILSLLVRHEGRLARLGDSAESRADIHIHSVSHACSGYVTTDGSPPVSSRHATLCRRGSLVLPRRGDTHSWYWTVRSVISGHIDVDTAAITTTLRKCLNVAPPIQVRAFGSIGITTDDPLQFVILSGILSNRLLRVIDRQVDVTFIAIKKATNYHPCCITFKGKTTHK